MNWDDLRVFLAVARSKRLAPAAAELGVDPTTVGRRVQRLEQAVDATLFEQGAAGYVLTERGRQLYEHAEAAERSLRRGIGTVTSDAGPAGTVRVSVVEGFGSWIVARHLGAFHRQHPRIVVDLIATSGILNPSRREADVAIMLARPTHGPLVARKLTDYRLGLYASADYVATNAPIERAADVTAHCIVGYVPDHIYTPELNYLDEVIPGLEPAIRSSSINAQFEIVASGGGIGILPKFIAAQDQRLVRLLPGEVAIERTFWLVVHKELRRTARVAAFTDWLASLVQQQRRLLV